MLFSRTVYQLLTTDARCLVIILGGQCNIVDFAFATQTPSTLADLVVN